MSETVSRRHFLALGSAVLLAAACGRDSPRRRNIAKGSPVLALGDSLTFGYGAAPETAYPAVLSDLTGWQVRNGGISGDTSAQALARLPALLADKPELVIVGIGGNDFLRKYPTAETRRNIDTIIRTLKTAETEAVLIGIPHLTVGALFGRLSDHPLYAELAGQHQIPLLSGAWAEILGDERLKSDQIHANAAGYRRFAEILADFLRRQGFR